ncbi:3-hydroxyacyl-CoA dehydrogenase NAD-binding domain-containing protein [Hoeflea prorocentri]|uniref:3-hydroxyacyl-CoA dehydrogenase NAD-binding domain-containing protein n=1 Tax=Hoeflea prorocentri TaxID=1922333 RepID=A0A9X3UKX3_9HYPH|nr:3-hydroxyacyl-CoA dehydrogenase NAD-binding domain-containing protein [Hoeflea prorocentri]MCY6380826.1 3-hydroxyacyl-CoA dehydrogenase NAD-binding domain-containing protein [Hoeflea prorocentri]MDA5398626.1 3-hydroxyacyl-CoA dehydrogenase NAD-binding domain-containing protein [Hoeflea prorocentri]
MSEAVSYEVVSDEAGAIAVIAIDNPPVNAASHAVREGLAAAAARFAADTAQVAVIYGKGRTFIAGADIREFGKPMQQPGLTEVIDGIEKLDKPVVCAIHGTALGGGLETALSCHYRVAIKSARVGLPEVNLGLCPGAGGTQRLPRLTGVEAAADIVTSGRHVPAAEALKIGILDAVEDGDDPLEAGIAFARRVLAEKLPARRTCDENDKVEASRGNEELFGALRERVKKKAKGQLSPQLCLEAVIASAELPFTEGMAREREIFMELMKSPQREALIHAFFAERAVRKVPELETGKARPLNSAAVIGGGTMGSGITVSMLFAGLPVTMIERDEESAARGRQNVEKILDDGVRRGKFDKAHRDHLANDLYSVSSDIDSLKDADIVIEAAFENMGVKKDLFRQIDKHAKQGAVLASNTSYLNINEIAAATDRPQDVLGLHFFSPAHVMRLLEIVVADKTDVDVATTGFALAAKLKKVGVRAGVCDGFIGNRILERYLSIASYMVEDGTSPYDIDRAVLNFGYPMGPNQMGDLAGLDIGYANRTRKREEGWKGRYAADYMDRIAELGRYGQKTGRGFYIYEDGSRVGKQDPEVLEIIDQVRSEKGIDPRPLDEEAIMRRYMAAIINEGARVVEEGIALRPLDVDVTMLFGYGFPRWRGGPLKYADMIGLDKVLADIREFENEDADFWKPAKLLVDLVGRGENFDSLNKATNA